MGHLLQARLQLRRAPGRCRPECRRQARRCRRHRPVRPGEPGIHGDRRLRPNVDVGAGALPRKVPGQAAPVQARAQRRNRRVHAGQLPGLRRVPAERLCDRRLQPRVQDDRCRRPGCEGTPRRAANAARTVPVRPLPHRGAASGEQLPVPLELTPSPGWALAAVRMASIQRSRYTSATDASLDFDMLRKWGICREEADMTRSPAGEGPDIMGGPEPDEEGTDLMGGPRPGTDEMGGPEPDEEGTDLMGGPRAGTDEMGGPEPDEEGTDLMGGSRPGT